MSQTITAIYENGVLRPLDPVELAEHQQVRVIIGPLVESSPSDEIVWGTEEEWNELEQTAPSLQQLRDVADFLKSTGKAST